MLAWLASGPWDSLSRFAAVDPDRTTAITMWFLASATDALERQTRRAALPEGERAVWEATGAVFSDDHAVLAAAEREAEAFADLLERSLVGDDAVAAYLGVDRSRISQRVSARQIIFFLAPTGARCYPGWQFDDGRVLHGIAQVAETLRDALHPLVVDHWARTPNVDLLGPDDEAMSPIRWLMTGGDVDTVVELARQL